jgi:hypothetical protein
VSASVSLPLMGAPLIDLAATARLIARLFLARPCEAGGTIVADVRSWRVPLFSLRPFKPVFKRRR